MVTVRRGRGTRGEILLEAAHVWLRACACHAISCLVTCMCMSCGDEVGNGWGAGGHLGLSSSICVRAGHGMAACGYVCMLVCVGGGISGCGCICVHVGVGVGVGGASRGVDAYVCMCVCVGGGGDYMGSLWLALCLGHVGACV